MVETTDPIDGAACYRTPTELNVDAFIAPPD